MIVEDMTTQRGALLAARYRGVRTVEIDGRRVTYAMNIARRSRVRPARAIDTRFNWAARRCQ
jgi:hypothetical protein